MDSVFLQQYSEIWFKEAQQAYRSGKLDAAAQWLERLVAVNPAHAEGLHLRGLVAFDANQHASAEAWISHAINACSNPVFYNSLCIVQLTMQKFAAAVRSAREGLAQQPDFAMLHYHLALALQFEGNLPDAAAHYRKAIQLDPGNSEAHNNLGTVLNDLGDSQAALRHLRQALELAPDVPAIHNNLAKALVSAGEVESAELHFRRAIAADPENFSYYRLLAEAKRLSIGDPCVVSMSERIKNIDSLTPANQMHLHFALGQALADNGNHEPSFEHIQKANALYRASIQYDEALTLDLLRRIPDVITREILEARRGTGHPSCSPIFIVGMPRSGSTLVEQILSSHPKVFALGERPDFERALLARTNAGGRIDVDAIRAMTAMPLTPIAHDYLRRVDLAVELAATGNKDYQRTTDKYLFNFVYLGMIHLAFPSARLIHIQRDPVDTCLSIYSKLFADVPFAYDPGELGRYYRAYAGLMAHWRRILPEGALLEIQYEDLVNDFEHTVRRMLDHCGLDWDERCMLFHETRRPVMTMSAQQVRRPLFRSSLQRWRPPQPVLQPLLDGLANNAND
ncbi:tetratricopeptide repeat-containing sulfotransferase family protein [Paraburkholderia acidipaludis]|uniref:tetratricopeptide repeat-containing sulfotransferase family protein n=1 Tax=Paraburkholderia acidipaludis TaxID=660537 RepID=UPI000694370C|nr:sulfotransferase [Paraburkholderia acidipaludis]